MGILILYIRLTVFFKKNKHFYITTAFKATTLLHKMLHRDYLAMTALICQQQLLLNCQEGLKKKGIALALKGTFGAGEKYLRENNLFSSLKVTLHASCVYSRLGLLSSLVHLALKGNFRAGGR